MNTISNQLPETAPPTGLSKTAQVLDLLDTLVLLADITGNPGTNARESRAAVAELIAERDRLANIVRSHEAQITRMTQERATLIEAASRARGIFARINGDSDEAINDSCDGMALLDATLARLQGGAA